VAVKIRPETTRDVAVIRAVHEAAFGRDLEARIVDDVRGTDAWIPELSLVAEEEGTVVGHVLLSRARLDPVDRAPRDLLVLGPIGVLPGHQGRGVGSALMRRSIGGAVARAEPLIALVGHPSYYPRFGFEPGRALGLEPPGPWPDEAWMVLRLPPWTPDLRGTVRYPPAFPAD
jgi:putative acetyltransferase